MVGLSQNSWGTGGFSIVAHRLNVLGECSKKRVFTKNPHQNWGTPFFQTRPYQDMHAMKIRQSLIDGPDWRLKRNDETMNNHNQSSRI